jgi:hypothetical protein
MTEKKERLINAYHEVTRNWINEVPENKKEKDDKLLKQV